MFDNYYQYKNPETYVILCDVFIEYAYKEVTDCTFLKSDFDVAVGSLKAQIVERNNVIESYL